MISSNCVCRSSLVVLLLLLLSLFNVAAGVLPPSARRKSITQAEYEAYLLEYFPATDKYLFYTAGSQKQIEKFQESNPGYLYWGDFFLHSDLAHPWYKAFDRKTQMDDTQAASKAMASVATDQILVFGAVKYKTRNSVYTLHEYPIIRDNIEAGLIPSINHLVRDATSPTDIIAKEYADGRMVWEPGYGEDSTNASPVDPDSDDEDDEPECTRKRSFFRFMSTTKGRDQCCSGILCWVAVN